MNPKLTRRQIAVAAAAASYVPVLAVVTLRKLVAQAPPADQDWDKAARESHARNSSILAGFEIPMSLEPAFQFRA
jgi:hypothetical protein